MERPERGNRSGRKGRKKVCAFCADKIDHISYYRDIPKIRRCLSERAKIIPRRVTGTWRKTPAAADCCDQACKTSGSSPLYQQLNSSPLS